MQRILPALRVLLFSMMTMALASVVGCGLKGDLVLPEQAGPTPSSEDPIEDAPNEPPEEPPEESPGESPGESSKQADDPESGGEGQPRR